MLAITIFVIVGMAVVQVVADVYGELNCTLCQGHFEFM